MVGGTCNNNHKCIFPMLPAIGVLVAALVFTGCSADEVTGIAGRLGSGLSAGDNTVTRNIMTMDTLMSLSATGKDAQKTVDEAVEMIENANLLFDAENPQSEVSHLNSESGIRMFDSGSMSEDTYTVLTESIQLMEMTEGAYNPLIRPVIELWGFPQNRLYVPTETELEKVLSECNTDYLHSDNGSIILDEGARIDFGAIAKGYVSDRVMEICAENDIMGACMSLGGNIVCYGHKSDGSEYNIAIDYPDETGETGKIIGAVRLSNKIISTSSGAQRYLKDETTGKRYVHIIDPSSGYPADSDIKSVSIISEKGYLADGLSTACYVIGLDLSIKLWQKYNGDFDMIILTDDDEIYVTETIAADFTEYTGMGRPVVISR